MRRFAIAVVCCASLASAAATPIAAQSARDILSLHNDAISQRDLDGFLGTFADDAVVIWDGDVFTGREQIEQVYAGKFSPEAPQVRIVRQGRASGGGVVQEEAYVMADGAETCCTTSAIYVAEGRVIRVIVDSGEA